MSDATRDGGMGEGEVRAAGLKVHGDKLEQLLPRADAGGVGEREDGGAGPDASSLAPRSSINPDHPDQTSEPGSAGLMPGSYEQAGGEAGRRPSDHESAGEAVRAPGSRVPDPQADPRQRRQALDIASGETRGADPR